MPAFTLSVDHAQPRLDGARDRLSVTMAGMSLNSKYYADTWIDPVTNSVFLRPAPMYDAFYTSNAGIYAKQTLAGLDKNGGHKWVEVERFPGAGKVMQTSQAGDWIRTSAALGANRAVCVGFHNYSAGDDFTTLSFGWGTTTDNTNGVVIELYSNGEFAIFKDGVSLGVYEVNINANEWNTLVLIPCRHRELLIIANRSGGTRIVFEDITEDDASPVITPAQKFWVKNVTGSAQVQLFPMKFPSSGYLTSDLTSFSEPPSASDSLETWTNDAWAGGAGQTYRLLGHPSYAGTVAGSAAIRTTTDSGAFVNNGSNIQTRIRVSLTGDGNYSAAVYAAHVAYGSFVADTDDSEQFDDLLEYCQGVTLAVGDDDQGQEMTFNIRRPQELDVSVFNIAGGVNRPVMLALGSVNIFDGVLSPTGIVRPLLDDTVQSLSVECRDYTALLESYVFDHRVPLDGLDWKDALIFVVNRSGWPSAQMNITDPGLTISAIPGAMASELQTVIEPGDTALKWVRQLMEDYASTWEWGFRPTATGLEFYALSQAVLGTTPHVTLYSTIDDAISVGGYSTDEAFEWVYRDYNDTQVEPEGNIVRVTGYDPRARRPIQAFKFDSASVDPTTVPSARPANWLGAPRRVALASPALNTQDEVDAATEEIYDRVTGSQFYAQVTCRCPLMGTDPDMFPIWRSRNVELDGIGVFRVVGLTLTIEKEWTTGEYYRTMQLSLRYLS